jgi:quinol monooxygenase YgiN
MYMIKVLVVRHFLPDKEKDAARLLGELHRRELRQEGCINSDALWAIDDSSMWVDASTWTNNDQWEKWLSNDDYIEVNNKVQDLMMISEEVIKLKIIK